LRLAVNEERFLEAGRNLIAALLRPRRHLFPVPRGLFEGVPDAQAGLIQYKQVPTLRPGWQEVPFHQRDRLGVKGPGPGALDLAQKVITGLQKVPVKEVGAGVLPLVFLAQFGRPPAIVGNVQKGEVYQRDLVARRIASAQMWPWAMRQCRRSSDQP